MSHLCHAPGCKRQVPPRMFACRAHWFALPRRIRSAIWIEYREGQEVDKKPSIRYLAVQQYACAYLVFKPHDAEAVFEAIEYVKRAAAFQEQAILMGLGDPLENLVVRELPI